MSNATVTRLGWIDVAKGIGIMAVMIIHSIIPLVNVVTTYLSAFAIQLFFVVTGLTYHNEKYRKHLCHLFVVRGRQLLIPYILLYILTILIFVPVAPYLPTSLTSDQLIYWFIYGSGPPLSSTHLWFLPVLFFGLMLYAVLDRLSARIFYPVRLLWLIILPLLAWWIQTLFSPALVPWHLNAILIAASFMLVGNELRLIHRNNLEIFLSLKRNTTIFLLSIGTFLLVSTINGFTDLAVDNTGFNIWLYILSGLLGSLMCLTAAQIISFFDCRVNRLLALFGKHSQVVYESHPLLFYLAPVVLFTFNLFFGVTVAVGVNLWPLRLLLVLLLSLPLTIFVIERNIALRFLFRGTTNARS